MWGMMSRKQVAMKTPPEKQESRDSHLAPFPLAPSPFFARHFVI